MSETKHDLVFGDIKFDIFVPSSMPDLTSFMDKLDKVHGVGLAMTIGVATIREEGVGWTQLESAITITVRYEQPWGDDNVALFQDRIKKCYDDFVAQTQEPPSSLQPEPTHEVELPIGKRSFAGRALFLCKTLKAYNQNHICGNQL